MEDDKFNEIDSMVKLTHKGKLVNDVSNLYSDIAKNREVFTSLGRYGKRTRDKAIKSLYKDFKKGLKILDEKVPVYIELPKCVEQDNGQYKEESFFKNEEEQCVHISNLPEKIEEQKKKTKRLLGWFGRKKQ